MKSYVLLFAFTSLVLTSNSQIPNVNESRYIDEIFPGRTVVIIPVDFAQSDLLSVVPDSLRNLTVEAVDLVYTTFKEDPLFDQKALNDSRILQIKLAWPELSGEMVQWRSVGQTEAVTKEAAREMFHGFVIRFRPTPTVESMAEEIRLIDELLGLNAVEDEVAVGETNSNISKSSESISIEAISSGTEVISAEKGGRHTKWVSKGFTKDYDWECYKVDIDTLNSNFRDTEIWSDSAMKVPGTIGTIWTETALSLPKSAGKKGKKIFVHYRYYGIDSCDTKSVSIGHVAEIYSDDVALPDWFKKGDYGVVEEVFRRHPDWKNSMVAVDVTGSMYPYTSQTMAWVRSTQSLDQVMSFVFFNDGDMKRDNQKRAGDVGGIYNVLNDDFKKVVGMMKTAMSAGGGGDCPENNVEALIEGIEVFETANEIILVADNWATPRDMSLVSELDRPVHVIVCGGSSGINVAYIQLAYETGGSIHTIESDMEARDIEEGTKFKIGSYYYTLTKGKIIQSRAIEPDIL